MKDLVVRMKSDPEYKNLIEKIKTARPTVPAYNPSLENTEKWKADSMRQQGFDQLLAIFNITQEELR